MKLTIYMIINTYCCEDGPVETIVLNAFADEKQAQKCFQECKNEEKILAEENGWTIFDDSETCWDAGDDGFYNKGFSQLFLATKEVEVKG